MYNPLAQRDHNLCSATTPKNFLKNQGHADCFVLHHESRGRHTVSSLVTIHAVKDIHLVSPRDYYVTISARTLPHSNQYNPLVLQLLCFICTRITVVATTDSNSVTPESPRLDWPLSKHQYALSMGCTNSIIESCEGGKTLPHSFCTSNGVGKNLTGQVAYDTFGDTFM